MSRPAAKKQLVCPTLDDFVHIDRLRIVFRVNVPKTFSGHLTIPDLRTDREVSTSVQINSPYPTAVPVKASRRTSIAVLVVHPRTESTLRAPCRVSRECIRLLP